MIKYTYWGNHDAKTISPVVVQNRNRFVAVYAIKSVERNQTVTRYVSYGLNGRFRKLFDHYEQFRTANGKFVLVVSPYNHLASHSDWFTATCGFTEIAPIYMENALTFVKVGTEDEFADFSMLQN
ncbi:hypothetical protein PHMEG_0008301 [Phytophthora megakarya]|uniref:Uncharacterized protein n=1 Tax=Phytophthora megakarya TaxID=4795 RepID=A0A225WJY1_9STRA|nr:hypothetical protein PHMEG_0008301 [Phytophthora megakarya]